MVARVGLVIVAVATGAAWVFGALGYLGVGVADLPAAERSVDVGQRVVDTFLALERSYLVWDRWSDVASGMASAGLLLVIPSLSDGLRARAALTGGAAVAVVAEMIDVTKVIAIETGRFALDNDLTADFAAANMTAFILDWTATYVWAAGLVVMAAGFVVLAIDAGTGRWRVLTGLLAGSMVAVAVVDVFRELGGPLDMMFTVMTMTLVAWAVVARRHLDPAPSRR